MKGQNFHTCITFYYCLWEHVSAKRSIPLILKKEGGWGTWSHRIAGISQDTQSAVTFPPMALKFQIMPGWECKVVVQPAVQTFVQTARQSANNDEI